MAYYLNKNARFMLEVYKALQNHFGDKADVVLTDGNVKVKVKDGFPKEIDRLTDDEIKAGVMGGGVKQGINGEEFSLALDTP